MSDSEKQATEASTNVLKEKQMHRLKVKVMTKKQNEKKKDKKGTECIESGSRHSKLLINLHQKLQLKEQKFPDSGRKLKNRLQKLEGLFIIADKNIFYHGRNRDDSVNDLRIELNRLSTPDVRLQTYDQKLLAKINLAEMTLFSFNCQSLNKHAQDFRGNVLKNSDVLLLSETWLDNEKHVDVENFVCVVKFKRPDVRAGGVGIYKNIHKLQHIITEHTEIYARNTDFISIQNSSVGDLCAAQCKMSNGKTIIVVSVYISPGTPIRDIQDFIHHVLLPYTEGGSKLLNKNYHEFPLIVAGDFNVNFAKDESLPLINFLKEVLNLEIINDRKTSTTRCGTTIDAVFARFIDNLSTNLYVSHFSYHKPIVSIMEKNIHNEPIVPVMVEDMSIDESDV